MRWFILPLRPLNEGTRDNELEFERWIGRMSIMVSDIERVWMLEINNIFF